MRAICGIAAALRPINPSVCLIPGKPWARGPTAFGRRGSGMGRASRARGALRGSGAWDCWHREIGKGDGLAPPSGLLPTEMDGLLSASTRKIPRPGSGWIWASRLRLRKSNWSQSIAHRSLCASASRPATTLSLAPPAPLQIVARPITSWGQPGRPSFPSRASKRAISVSWCSNPPFPQGAHPQRSSPGKILPPRRTQSRRNLRPKRVSKPNSGSWRSGREAKTWPAIARPRVQEVAMEPLLWWTACHRPRWEKTAPRTPVPRRRRRCCARHSPWSGQ